jgi:hypothetical protein
MTHAQVTRARSAIFLCVVAIVVSWTAAAATPAAAESLFTLVSSCGRFDPKPFPFGGCEDLDANGNFPVDHGGFPIPGVPVKVANVRDNFTLQPSDLPPKRWHCDRGIWPRRQRREMRASIQDSFSAN